jgi:NADP-dependent 3-hydroxy acid dehydrogenase YdfG
MPALDQRVAVITGAATGIGCALAGRLAGEGVRLALADLNQVGLDEVSRSLTGYGFELSTHLVDVANARQVEEFARDVVDLYGRADVLINNAGVALFGDVEEVSLADIEWLMAVNFWGVVYGIKHFLPALKQQSKAYIVNISSAFGLIAPPGQAAYAASRKLAESARAPIRPSAIRRSPRSSASPPRAQSARRIALSAACCVANPASSSAAMPCR